MKISTKGQYALEALLDMALNAGDAPESLGDIARRRGLSEHYLEQIFNTLRKAGIVESHRGAQGGYRLARGPGAVTAGDVLRALEGPLSPVKCIISDGGAERCPMKDVCATRGLWQTVSDGIDRVVDSVTLADLIKAYEADLAGGRPEFTI